MKTQELSGAQVCKQFEKGRAKARPYNARTASMRNKKIDGVEVWKQYEDLVVPRLQLTLMERALYTHLVRHSRLEGKREIRFAIQGVARAACLTPGTVRKAMRSLFAKGALRLVERSKRGHVVEVRLPEEIRAVRACQKAAWDAETGAARAGSAVNLEEMDFLETPALRQAIHAREGGRCFYCLHRVKQALQCLDHVVPQVEMGGNSYRNLVSSCMGCNAQKREQKAEDFLRWLYREGRLSEDELKARLRAVEELAAGKLRPRLPGACRLAKISLWPQCAKVTRGNSSTGCDR